MKAREVIRALERDGWYLARQGKGDRRIYKHPTKPGIVVLNGMLNWEIPAGTPGSIWRQAGIKPERK